MSQTLKPTINVPMRFAIQFADLVEGKYGPQLRLKGTPEAATEPGYVYLPVDCANSLVGAGAKAVETPKGTTYEGIAKGLWTIHKTQAAGEKYPVTTLNAPGMNGKVEVPAAKHVEAGPGKPPEPASDDADAKLVALYFDSWDRVNAKILPTGVTFNPEGFASAVATLFIARSKLVMPRGW